MSDDRRPSVWADEWEFESDEEWTAGRWTKLPRGEQLGATVCELAAGRASGFYHFHHGTEELLIVLSGTPTLRAPAGERELAEGEVVLFAVGPDGAHQLRNDTDEPVRYVMVSTRPSPEAVEYPDSRQLSVMAFTDSQDGRPLWDIRTLEQPEG
jgi:uncharacterized cupin superfamily protein